MARDRLETYRSKRRRERTPEPVPRPKRGEAGARDTGAAGRAKGRRGGGPAFVIQEHHARSLHWDFRLERDGVLVSWALPRGLPLDPAQNRLAVPTEDHPLEYGSFEGEIPAGEYGAGKVILWDRGVYECDKWTDREVMVVLHGERAKGRYVLFRAGTGGRKDWMIHRMDPAPEGWEPVPRKVRPMVCSAGELPAHDEGWAYELKWDGVRATMHVERGELSVTSRSLRDITVTYPELRAIREDVGARQVLLDGEIIALDDEGRPSFGVLQQRMHVADAGRARRLAARVPVSYLAFDLLHLDGRPTMQLAWDERRKLLESLELSGPNWSTPPAFVDVPGTDVQRAADERGLEGIVAKRRDSTYQPGRRSEDWVKVKQLRSQEVVVGGWTPGKGKRTTGFGALLLGLPEPDGLRYVGKVGTGFSETVLKELGEQLRRLSRRSSPFAGRLPKTETAEARWVSPELVGEVDFTEWTRDGRLRASRWRGLRSDKTAADVVRER